MDGRLIFFLLPAALVLGGCSAKQTTMVLERTERAAVNAVTDPVTWAPAAGAAVLYATPYDTKLTDYFMQHHWTGEADNSKVARELNGALTIGTAALVPEKKWEKRVERVIVEAVTLKIASLTSYALETGIHKETPDGMHDYAIGSNHALPPFAGSAMTRRNVGGLPISQWGGYGLIGVSYLSSTVSALSRVEDGGHSFADQLVSASAGNFIGLFFHDLFLLKEDVTVQASVWPSGSYVSLTFRY